MDHGRYGQLPAFTSGNNHLPLHFHTPIPSLVSEVPFYLHQVQNPNVSPPLPPPSYSPQTGWNNGLTSGGINLNHGSTSNYVQTTTIRWPRQETLALLEIRSRLDPCFKEATSSNHKAPLWDEISRIMNEEYGYQRSGRKCKEKFENLYKYYKKTKEGKVGKNDGKHYRFFRQLEALFGDQNDIRGNDTNMGVNPSSQSNYSCESNDDDQFDKKELIDAIEESIESNLTKLMAKQEEWGEKILSLIERREQERVVMEEEWRKQEGARLDNEYEAWASHVARIETRDKSLLDALQNLIRVRAIGPSHRNIEPVANLKENGSLSDQEKCKNWIEPEISSLIQIRTNKECKFQDADQENGERLWGEVAFELSLLGYNRSENDCKEAWDKICVDFNKTKIGCEKTGKEVSSRTSNTMNINGEHSWKTM
nr:hypothetical protein [Tanacetum cinerariifolium]